MTSGSQLVSTTATTGRPSLRASVTAMCSFFVSMTKTALGRRSRSAMPPRLRVSFSSSRVCCRRLPLGHAVEVAGRLHGPQLLHALHPARHGGEVGQHAAEPALVDVRHPAGLGVLGDRALGLLLRADEEDGAAVGDEVADERVGGLDAAQRLAQVDEIDPVALTQDVALHLRVPSARLVAEVDSGLQKLSHGNDGHRDVPPVGCSPGAAPPEGGDRGTHQVMMVGCCSPPRWWAWTL